MISVLLILLSANSFAKEKVQITINGESYSKEMPKDYDSAIELINYLAELERNADAQSVDTNKKYVESVDNYESQISSLSSKIDSLEKTLEEAKSSSEKTEKDIKSLTSVNSRLEVALDIGPLFGYDSTFVAGSHTGVILDYRIFKNMHIGGNIFFNAFTNQTRPFEAGVGLILGYSLY